MGLAASAAGEQLQLADPQKGWCHAGGDRRRVVHQDVGIERPGVRGVPGPAHGFGSRHIQRQRAGGGNPQGVHEVLRQKLAHAGAEHGTTIGATAVGRGATAFQLHLPASAVEQAFEYGNGPAIAIAVAGAKRALLDVFGAVDREGITGCPTEGSHRLPRHADVAGKQTEEVFVVSQFIAQAQFVEEASAVRHVFRRWNRGWPDRYVVTGEHLAGLVIEPVAGGLRIRMQGIQQRIVGPLCKLRERGCRHGCRRCCRHWSLGLGAVWAWP